MRYDVEGAQDIAVETQAYDAQGAAAQAIAQTVRSQSGTAAALTSDTRANKATTTGSLANDLYYETDTGFTYRWSGTAWVFAWGIGRGSAATLAAITVTAADNGAEFYVTDTGSWWYVAAGVWVERTKLNVVTEYKVGGNKVLGARGAAVAAVASPDATDLATAQTLVNEIKAQLNTFISRFRVTGGHGSIAD